MSVTVRQQMRSIESLCVTTAFAALFALSPATAQNDARFPQEPFSPASASQNTANRQQGTASSDNAQIQTDRNFESEQLTNERSDANRNDSRDQDSADSRNRNDRTDNDLQQRQRTEAVKPPQLPSEFETYVSQLTGRPVRRFGSNLLVPRARDFTAPPTATIPPDYRLNPGDEIVIGLSGSVEADNVRLIVDTQGRVFVPRVGSVNVAGVRFADLPAVLSRRISRQFRNFDLSVGIGRIKGITVFVTGFATTPGSYSVNSLSTIVNAVLAAGGPSAGGSFRSIQLRRGGRLVSDFDLYDLLLRGNKTGDAVLQNGDVIYLAPVGAQVAVIGSVNSEAIFEVAPGESVTDVLTNAGGLNTVADDGRALILNPFSKDATPAWEQLTAAEAAGRPVSRGVVVRILSGIGLANPQLTQPVLVTISGEVGKPGRYYMPPGSRMSDLLGKAGGLTGQAFPFGTVIGRDSVKELQRESYERALRDFELTLTLKPVVSANIAGSGATDTSFLAVAQSIVKQLRERRPDGRLILDLPLASSSLPSDLLLENNDAILIPPRATSVGVFGAVNSPSSFYFDNTGRIKDYLDRAGGVQKFGDRKNLYVVRANGTVLSGQRALGQPALPGDLIFVPINATRGEFWARLRDLSAVLLPVVTTAAVVAAATRK